MTATLTNTAELSPGYRPGERMLAGKPYVFDMDALRLHLSHEAVLTAPADLTRLTYDEVFGLLMSAQTVLSARPERTGFPYRLNTEAAFMVATRAADERESRLEYQRSYGRAS